MAMSDPTRSAQFFEFFVTKKGKRKVRLGACSTLDELILGRDFDGSGEDPHKEFMRKFGDHAGMKSGHEMENRKRPGFAQDSTMDSVIWGRDFDKSGDDPGARFLETYPEHAGLHSTSVNKSAKKPGYAMSSTMDSVIWGRDFDGSGEDPHKIFKETYHTHAGAPSGFKGERRAKKRLMGNACTVDEVLTGEDKDGSTQTEELFQKMFDGHAGTSSAKGPVRPYRKPGISAKSSVDNVIWGRDLDQSGDDFYEEHFAKHFQGCAGNPTGHRLGNLAMRRAASAGILEKKERLAARKAAKAAVISAIPDAYAHTPRTPRSCSPGFALRSEGDGAGAPGAPRMDTPRSRVDTPRPAPDTPRASASPWSYEAPRTPRTPRAPETPRASASTPEAPPSPAANTGSASARGNSRRRSSSEGAVRRKSVASVTSKSLSVRNEEELPPQLREGKSGSRRSSVASMVSDTSSLHPGKVPYRPPSRTGSMGSLTSRDYGSFHQDSPPKPKVPEFRPRSNSVCSTAASMISSAHA